MSLALLVRRSAQRDLAGAFAYYADHDRGHAFLEAVEQTFMQIADLRDPAARPHR